MRPHTGRGGSHGTGDAGRDPRPHPAAVRVGRHGGQPGRTPAGALFHAGGPSDRGYRVVEVWQTREAAESFYGSELYRQAVTAADVRTEPEIVMTWTVEGLDDGHGWRATT
ncbi:hypothetical protein [Geodermatophilus telluris]|uniref:hypothetical protein n=1 Tax=Geodermatophilus telluris TaxID=1190417 RepID=UPI0011134FEB|nr:hypothetical protein [Geodermatophilus telluris]